MSSWKRPDSVPFPSIWHSFKAPDPDTGKDVVYRVQDLPENRFEDAIEFMTNNFLPDESWCKGFHLIEDEISVKDFQRFWRQALPQKVALACFKDGSDEFVGLNLLRVITKEDKDKNFNAIGDIFLKTGIIYSFLFKEFDVFEKLNLDVFLNSYGLSVSPHFRRLGIAEQIWKTRVPLMKAVGISYSATVFSGDVAQRSAEKAGFKTLYEIKYSELASLGMEVPAVKDTYCRWMGLSAE